MGLVDIIIMNFRELLAAGQKTDIALNTLHSVLGFFIVSDTLLINIIKDWQQSQDTAAIDELVQLCCVDEAEELAGELALHAQSIAGCPDRQLADFVYTVFQFYGQLEADVLDLTT